MANEVEVKIPENMSPFVVIVNGVEYSYPAGTTQMVPEEVAEVIWQHVEAMPKPVPNSGGGGDMLVTITVIMPADAEAQPEFLADKTFAEIESAVNAKQNVRAKISGGGPEYYTPLAFHSQGSALLFSSFDAYVEIYPDRVTAGMLR